ncbi:MAG: ISAs1 family transposase [Pyrinomonadaceae bacterium]|nr:ISAs1 family transposase [Pyrinomonadaceae bacterium]
MNTRNVPSLRDALAEVPDFRQAQGRRYELLPVLLLCCVAVMCGARSQSAIADWGANYGAKWLARLGIRRRRAPSQPTLHRLFKGLDCAALERAVSGWAEAVLAAESGVSCLEGLAIDGKTLRGSAGQGAAQSHLISALSHRLGLVMAQLAVTDKSHELGHLEPLLTALILDGRVVTCDALHTHADVAQMIVEGGGDYLLPVKDNQPTLRSDIALVFAHATTLADTITSAQSVDAHGDRIETRRLRASTALVGYTDFPAHQTCSGVAAHDYEQTHWKDARRTRLWHHLTTSRAGFGCRVVEVVARTLAYREQTALCARCHL